MNSLKEKKNCEAGFSMVEMILVMTIMLITLGLVSTVFTVSLSTNDRESQKTDALTTLQAAINVMSREIANSGYGLNNNGIILDNTDGKKIHFRANIQNDDLKTDDVGEEVMYYYDADIDSIVRYDRFAIPSTAIIINRVSSIDFTFYDFEGSSSIPTQNSIPSEKTGKVKIDLRVQLENVPGRPENENVSISTEVALRNSVYMLNQY